MLGSAELAGMTTSSSRPACVDLAGTVQTGSQTRTLTSSSALACRLASPP